MLPIFNKATTKAEKTHSISLLVYLFLHINMGSNNAPLAFSYTLLLLLLLLLGFASSNLDQDRAECADQLVGLATCLPYVGGDAKTPTLDCCTGIKQVLKKSKKCLCVLIKDRDDPNLGLKINATLALALPSACHAPSNISECVCEYYPHTHIRIFTIFFATQLIAYNIGDEFSPSAFVT